MKRYIRAAKQYMEVAGDYTAEDVKEVKDKLNESKRCLKQLTESVFSDSLDYHRIDNALKAVDKAIKCIDSLKGYN